MISTSAARRRPVLGLAAIAAAGLTLSLTAVPATAASPVWRPHSVQSAGVPFTPYAVAGNPFSPDGRLLAGSSTRNGVTQAAVYDVSTQTVRLLGSKVPGTASVAIDVNDGGDVVGSVSFTGGDDVFVLSSGATSARRLAKLGARELYPTAINNSATVVGGWLGDGNTRAFRWQRSTNAYELLPGLPSAVESFATGIDSAGRIIGDAGLQGYVWSPTTRTAKVIARPGDDRTAYPRDLNDAGTVVGVLDGAGDDDNQAFSYRLSTAAVTVLPGREAYAKTITRTGVIAGNVGTGQAAVWNACGDPVRAMGSSTDPAYRVTSYGVDQKGALWTTLRDQTVRWTRTPACP